ncbi:DUF4181 domain-containing protein [Priestia megaterium]|uniref:DUF4181 domain-containing protein n=1 Tax=Priestia megaterium TaxID=1404 RepID=UPI0013E351C3|nr:DUF4181 domain-containing protein [Priestia megaterium]MED3863992.1 DUF4181 domain-containing protein [Priestia megaterium]MED4100562.1 DUF4181 domain-containing protein [Priestia megaterium]MED4144387.1 DUF4181 domain-containing protein [Priestia megaterium]MED4165686.1 DUF4181 domain-containing protein [Priestia megaterium]MED4198168.1 DUF4181 domain-containing protein [Priestia megaterium]
MYILIMLVVAAILVDFILRKVLEIPRSKFWGKYEYESLALERWDKYVMVAFVLFLVLDMIFMFVEPYIVAWWFLGMHILLKSIDEWKYKQETKEYVTSFVQVGFFFTAFVLLASGIV